MDQSETQEAFYTSDGAHTLQQLTFILGNLVREYQVRYTRNTSAASSSEKVFFQAEIGELLDIIERFVLACIDKWTAVASEQTICCGVINRREEGLPRNFSKLYSKTVPIGDPKSNL